MSQMLLSERGRSFLAASGTGLLIFIFIHDGSNMMNFKVDRNVQSQREEKCIKGDVHKKGQKSSHLPLWSQWINSQAWYI